MQDSLMPVDRPLSIPDLATLAAEKQANARLLSSFGPRLIPLTKQLAAPFAKQVTERAAPAVKQVAERAAPAVKRLVRPTVAPRPELVSAAAGRATAAGPVKSNLAAAGRYLANVPQGERFAQRPLANMRRALTFDGLPLMRRINQGALAGLGYGGASVAYNQNADINQAIRSMAEQASQSGAVLPGQQSDFENSLNGLKWQAVRDQTVGRLGRVKDRWKGETPAPQDTYMNRLVGSKLRSAVGGGDPLASPFSLRHPMSWAQALAKKQLQAALPGSDLSGLPKPTLEELKAVPALAKHISSQVQPTLNPKLQRVLPAPAQPEQPAPLGYSQPFPTF
jgi:hypothetical protein